MQPGYLGPNEYFLQNWASSTSDEPMYLTSYQLTSSDGYAPGYAMLQLSSAPSTFTLSEPAAGTYTYVDTCLAVGAFRSDGRGRISSIVDGNNLTLNYYMYDDSTRIWLPVRVWNL